MIKSRRSTSKNSTDEDDWIKEDIVNRTQWLYNQRLRRKSYWEETKRNNVFNTSNNCASYVSLKNVASSREEWLQRQGIAFNDNDDDI